MLHIDCRGRETGKQVPLWWRVAPALRGQVSDNRQGFPSRSRNALATRAFVLE
jgi:hypothetical protein